jgi:hypothetical protein
MLDLVRPNVVPFFICPESDKHLQVIAEDYEIETFLMPQDVSQRRFCHEFLNPYLDRLSDFDCIFDANFITSPFLKITTGERLLRWCEDFSFSFVPVLGSRNLVWDEGRACILGKGELADTKRNPIHYVPAHIAHIYTYADAHLSEGELSAKLVPVPIELDIYERIDIDTKEDLALANIVYKEIREYHARK